MAVTLDRKRPEAAIPQLEKMIQDVANSVVDKVYPVGSYYETSKRDYDPGINGGEWELETNTSPYKWHRVR